MAEQQIVENLGEIVIAPEVLEVIISVTTSKVEGVYSLRSKRTLDSIGKKAEGKGVYIRTETEDERVIVDIYVYLVAGKRVPEIAQTIQKEVKEKVLASTDIEISEVNIHVMGIVSETASRPDFDDLFKEGFFDVD